MLTIPIFSHQVHIDTDKVLSFLIALSIYGIVLVPLLTDVTFIGYFMGWCTTMIALFGTATLYEIFIGFRG